MPTTAEITFAALAASLCCPQCRGRLDGAPPETLECSDCGRRFVQTDPRVVDLLPLSFLAAGRARWEQRQALMVGEYAALLADREHALLAYGYDLPPLAHLLARHTGRVLDLGGGNGIVRHWLPPGTELVLLEPDVAWLDQPWHSLADVYPCLAEPPWFVRGVGEHLPFADASFDGVLSIWSLNHVADPARTLAEVARVLRPRGRLLLVLEDVPPTWHDVLSGTYPTRDRAHRTRVVLRKLAALLTGWPLQPDHLRLREPALARWCAPALRRVERLWKGTYLVWELERTGSPLP